MTPTSCQYRSTRSSVKVASWSATTRRRARSAPGRRRWSTASASHDSGATPAATAAPACSLTAAVNCFPASWWKPWSLPALTGVGHLPHPGPEAGIEHELGHLHPGLDLLGGGIVGEGRRGQAHGLADPGGVLAVAEGLGDEVVHQALALEGGQSGKVVHDLHLLVAGSSVGDHDEHTSSQAQGGDLGFERPSVDGGDLRSGGGALEHRPDGLQPQSEAAKGGHQLETSDGGGVVAPVPGRRAPGGRHNPGIGPEADGPHRHARAPRHLSDAQRGLEIVHARESVTSSRWRCK